MFTPDPSDPDSAAHSQPALPARRSSAAAPSSRLVPLGLLGLLALLPLLLNPSPPHASPSLLSAGLATTSSGAGTAATTPGSELLSDFRRFDRGPLGFQVEPPDPQGSDSWTPPIIVRKTAAPQDLPLPSRRTRWQYLTQETRRDIRLALENHPDRPWRRLVIHESAGDTGNATLLLQEHQRRWPRLESSAYHFVIGNGSFSGDGEIETGLRWYEQEAGAALGVDELNEASLSVCLIGSFHESPPSAAQWQALDELLVYLRAQVGVLDLVTHREIESSVQGCPGPSIQNRHLSQLGGAAVRHAGDPS